MRRLCAGSCTSQKETLDKRRRPPTKKTRSWLFLTSIVTQQTVRTTINTIDMILKYYYCNKPSRRTGSNCVKSSTKGRDDGSVTPLRCLVRCTILLYYSTTVLLCFVPHYYCLQGRFIRATKTSRALHFRIQDFRFNSLERFKLVRNLEIRHVQLIYLNPDSRIKKYLLESSFKNEKIMLVVSSPYRPNLNSEAAALEAGKLTFRSVRFRSFDVSQLRAKQICTCLDCKMVLLTGVGVTFSGPVTLS